MSRMTSTIRACACVLSVVALRWRCGYEKRVQIACGDVGPQAYSARSASYDQCRIGVLRSAIDRHSCAAGALSKMDLCRCALAPSAASRWGTAVSVGGHPHRRRCLAWRCDGLTRDRMGRARVRVRAFDGGCLCLDLHVCAPTGRILGTTRRRPHISEAEQAPCPKGSLGWFFQMFVGLRGHFRRTKRVHFRRTKRVLAFCIGEAILLARQARGGVVKLLFLLPRLLLPCLLLPCRLLPCLIAFLGLSCSVRFHSIRLLTNPTSESSIII